MSRLFIVLSKILNWLPVGLMLRTRRWFEKLPFSLACYKGPCIVVANHRGFLDFLLFLWLFLFRTVRTVVGETLYDSSKPMSWLLKKLGCIRTDRFSGDPEWLYTSVEWLQGGGILLLFPEGHFETSDEVEEFRSSLALLAVQSGAPVLPVYHTGLTGYPREYIAVGEPMDLAAAASSADPAPEELAALTAAVRDRVIALKALCERRRAEEKRRGRNPIVRFFKAVAPSNWIYDFFKVTGALAMWVTLPPRYLYAGCDRRVRYFRGPAVVTCNHRWWIDPILVSFYFPFRRPYTVIAEEQMGTGFRRWLMKRLRCIPVKRGQLDIDCFRECQRRLSEGRLVVVMPEGKINTSPAPLLSFKEGAALMAMQAKVPVIPFAVDGIFRPIRRMNVAVGAPIDPFEAVGDTVGTARRVAALTEVCRARTAALFATAFDRMTEKEKAFAADYQLGHRRYMAAHNGMTLEEYDAWYAAQEGSE